MIEEDLKSYLATQTGKNVFALIKPQGINQAIVYQRISTQANRTQSGPVDLCRARFQVTCWGETYSDAKSLAKSVKDAMECNTSQWELSYLVELMDMKDPEENLYRIVLDFMIWYKE